MDELTKLAASKGWEAAMVAFITVSAIGFIAWIVREQFNKAFIREERMAKRIDGLEDFQRNILVNKIDENTQAFMKLCETLHVRPCMLTDEELIAIGQSKNHKK